MSCKLKKIIYFGHVVIAVEIWHLCGNKLLSFNIKNTYIFHINKSCLFSIIVLSIIQTNLFSTVRGDIPWPFQ